MGFWDAVSSFASSVVSTVSSCVSTVAKGVSNIVGSAVSAVKSSGIGGALIKGASNILKGITTAGTGIISSIGQGIGQAFGVLNEKENVDVLAHKAMGADIDMDEFNSVNDYIDAVRKESIDMDEFENVTPEQYVARKAVGATIISEGVSEKLDMNVTPEFLTTMSNNLMTPKDTIEIIKSFKEANVDLNVVEMLNGDLDDDLDAKLESMSLVETGLTNANPTLDKNAIAEKIISLSTDKQTLEAETIEKAPEILKADGDAIKAKIEETKEKQKNFKEDFDKFNEE